jgi:cysteine desulfurase
MIRSYLDANATTRPLPEVVEAVRRSMEDDFLNVSSAAAAFWAGDPVGDAKRALARLLDAEGDEFVLTSGASESNSWAVSTVAAGGHLVTSAIEHPSLREAAGAAARRGVDVTQVPPDGDGVIAVEAVLAALTPRTQLVSVMLANNETGVIQPIAAIAEAVRDRAPQAMFHTDATQAVGKIKLSLAHELACVDLLSLSAHKFHGPKGVGALFRRSGTRLPAIVHGEQEGGSRGGTYNTPGLRGMAVAADTMRARLPEWSSRIRDLRDRLETSLLERLPLPKVNGAGALRLPNTTSVTIPGLDAAALVDSMAAAGICASTGSACSSGATAPSHVLMAMGLSSDQALATLRFSLSIDTSWSDVSMMLGELAPARKMIA